METSEMLALILIFVFGAVFFVLVENTVLTIDTSAWAFTGHDFVITFLPFVPWLFLIACLVVPVFWMMKK